MTKCQHQSGENRGTKPRSSDEKSGGKKHSGQRAKWKNLCVSALLCKDESEPILQRKVKSTYVEVRDPKRCDASMSKGEIFLCYMCKAKVAYAL